MIRGTVQGILAASLHVLWYIDHATGGHAARPITD
jgi:hypothetical protein